MIKSTILKSEYEEIYRLMDTVSPLSFDCGKLCGAVCCGTQEEEWDSVPESPFREDRSPGEAAAGADGNDETGDGEFFFPEMGIYLLPGEEKLHSKKDSWLIWSEERAEDFAFPESWKGKVYFVRCKTPPECPREKRPIQCRTFPLAPHFMPGGRLVMILNDQILPYRCPLIEEEPELEPDFLEITHRCWTRLVQDPLIRDLVKMESEERYEDGCDPVPAYDPEGCDPISAYDPEEGL